MSTYVFARNGMGSYTDGTGMREDMLMQAFNIYNYQAGVVLSGDLLVTERAAGANMSVDVAPGRCFIANSSYVVNTANRTRFWGMLSDAVVNLPISTNTSGSTRYDLIIAKINTGSAANAYATNVGTIEVVQGTPGGGQPSTPNNSELLGVLEIPDGTTTQIVDADITDSRKYCGTQTLYKNAHHMVNSSGSVILKTYVDSNNNIIYGKAGSGIVKVVVPTNGNIQAAINLNTSLVELMPGSHVITSEISTPDRDITIQGSSFAATKIICTSNISRIFNIARTISYSLEIKNLQINTNNGVGTFDGVIFDFTTSGFFDSMNIENIEINCDVVYTNRRIIDTTGGGEYRNMNIDIRIKTGEFNTAINLEDVRNSYIKCISDTASTLQEIDLDSNSDRNIVIACQMTVNDLGIANQILATP